MGEAWRIVGIGFMLQVGLVAAEEIAPVSTPVPEPVPIRTSSTKSPLIRKRAKRREQKETEGTEAPERFEADTILKSPYSAEGQPLEVDPD